jgi:sodium-dependent phosphate transporter
MKSQTLLSFFGVAALATVAYAHSGVEPRDFFWIVICETIMTAITAWGIGANDVANCFGTSVGSKSLTLWQAVIVASIFEFLGAFVLGSNVTDTVRKKIVEPCAFEKNPEFLMLGMFCADVATGLWLAVATYLRFPVSTTHSVIGAIIGFGLGAYGPSVVLWDKVGMVVLSWVTAPLSSCVAAAIIFFLVRFFILRHENSYERALKFYPILLCFTLWINLFFMAYKGAAGIKKALAAVLPAYVGLWVCLGVALVIAVPVGCIIVPFMRKRIDRQVAAEEEEEQAAGTTSIPVHGKDDEKVLDNGEEAQHEKKHIYDRDLHGDALDRGGFFGAKGKAIHEAAEVFDVKTEYTFNWIQVITACFDSFAHGANDVANAVSTLAATVMVYNENDIPGCNGSKAGKSDVPLWILALGGVCIGVGVATWGYKIIETIGIQMVRITPSRGFCIELASSLTVITSSILGAPVSTTQVQVGATIGCGLVDGKVGGVNWWLFGKVFAGWALTLVVAGAFSAALVGAMLWSPSMVYLPQYHNMTEHNATLASWLAMGHA